MARKVDWRQVAETLLHPAQVEILCYLAEHPEVSAVDLHKSENGLSIGLPNWSYHVRCLAKCGLIRETRTQAVRGAIQHFYELA